MDHQIAVVDVETTGLSPWHHDRIVEIAVVLLDLDGRIRAEYETLINPGRDVGPTRIHGITASDVVDAPAFADVAGDVLNLLRSASAVAGHNVSFDRNFLVGEFGRLPASFPDVPLLCTCHLMGRQSLAACCDELGIDLVESGGGFHNALFDAKATARIVSLLLSEDPGLLAVSPGRIRWPDIPPLGTSPVTRKAVRNRLPSPPAFLQRIVSKGAYDTEAGSPAVLTYLTLLDRVLEDRVIDASEQEVLVSTIEHLGLSRGQVTAAHTTYLQHLTAQALADGVVTDLERTDLETVARLLGTDTRKLDSLLDETREQLEHLTPVPHSPEDLTGLSVCFTGELQSAIRGKPVTRAVAQGLAEKAGLAIANSVTKKLDLLVVADPNTQSGKAKKARAYGTRIVAEPVFWQMIGVGVD